VFDNLPGVQIKEVRLGGPPIAGVGTSTAGFVGVAPKADHYVGEARLVTSADQFAALYILGTPPPPPPDTLPHPPPPTPPADHDATVSTPLSRAVLGFFANGGHQCYVVNVGSDAAEDVVNGLKLLEVIDAIAIIAAPGHTEPEVYVALEEQATRTGDRFAILDPPPRSALVDSPAGTPNLDLLKIDGANHPPASDYAAFYYPRILVGKQLPGDPDPDPADPESFVTPVGHIAGVYARVDSARGVHKAPANEQILGALGVEHAVSDSDQDVLNKESVNVLRVFSGATVVWGARTLSANQDWRYINVRRLVNYIEESLQDGLRWAVFEPNTLALRQQIARSVRGFLDGVWRDGALFGATAEEAYDVRFPELYNTDAERALGRLTVEIGLRVTFPAEFIIVRIGLLLQSANAA
jgi:phage tail sheath protein FI